MGNLRSSRALPQLLPKLQLTLLLALLSPLLLLSTPQAHADELDAPPDIAVTMTRPDGRPSFDVSATITVAADRARSWSVLTGYDRLAQFVPNLSSSHVVARDGNTSVVAQTGFARFLFIRQSIDLLLQVSEQPMQAIDIRMVRGNLRNYQARWRLDELEPSLEAPGGRTRLTYEGVLAPDFFIPPLFGPTLVKSDLRSMLVAVKTEIESDRK